MSSCRGLPSGACAAGGARACKSLIANYPRRLGTRTARDWHTAARSDRMKTRLLATVVILIPLAGLAADNTDPGTPPNGGTASFEALDANKDGRISMPEASVDPKLVEEFSTADKDGDGYLDSSEYANAVDAPPQQ